MAAPPVTPVRITSDGLTLEGRLYQPMPASRVAVVVCHPHPQRGGDMDNNVVLVAAETLRSVGIAALTFNFRGVGRSQGRFSAGKGEEDDARAALAHARGLAGVEKVGLAGYSFGAGIAAALAVEGVEALSLISIPALALDRTLPSLQATSGPLLLISGSEDHTSTEPALRKAAGALGDRAELVIVPGADHFWWGFDDTLSQALGDFFGRLRPPSES
jgi:alpha/beta superfamily hydrolase